MKTYSSVIIERSRMLLTFCLLLVMVEGSMAENAVEPELSQIEQNPVSEVIQSVLKQEFCPFVKVEVLLEQLNKHVEILQQNSIRLDVKTENTETSVNKLDTKMDILREHINETIALSRSQNHQQQLTNLQSDVSILVKTCDQLRNELSEVKGKLLENKDVVACNVNAEQGRDCRKRACVTDENGIPQRNPPEDCWDWLQRGNSTSGIYDIYPLYYCRQKRIQVYCDMETNGGGWTVFQRRADFPGSREDFFKNWIDYKWGFGDLQKEFWLGLDYLSMITNSKRSSLRIDLQDFDGNKRYAFYRQFYIRGEDDKYRLKLSGYTGDAGDAMSGANNALFTTKDEDNDANGKNCAVVYTGAWWYTSCHSSNLNGRYLMGNHTTYADGVNWKQWLGYHYSLKMTEMKTRPAM